MQGIFREDKCWVPGAAIPCRSVLARDRLKDQKIASKLAPTSPFMLYVQPQKPHLQKRLSPAEAGLGCQFQVLADAGAFGAIVAIFSKSRRVGFVVAIFSKGR